MNDLRYAIRGLVLSPSFTWLTIVTLAIGVGAVAAIFAVVDAVLLAPLVTDQDRVVRIWHSDASRGFDRVSVSYPEYRYWRDHSRAFSGLAAIQYADATTMPLAVGRESTAIKVAPVSADFFDVLYGAAPHVGRWFAPSDDQANTELVAVVSFRFLQRVAGGNPNLVGSTIDSMSPLGPIRIVGVAPAAFDYPIATDMWVPIGRFFDGRDGRFNAASHLLRHFEVVGRLDSSVTIDDARAELRVLDEQLLDQFPKEYRGLGLVIQPLIDTVAGTSRQILWLLFAAATLVFVIGGVNVASLLLMRSIARRRELHVRLALGASYARLAWQTVVEALVLGGAGAIAGLFVAAALLRLVQWLPQGDVPRIDQAVLDLRAVSLAIGATMAWVLCLGTAPLWRPRLLVARGLTASEGSLRVVRGTRALRVFTIAEIAAAVVVAVGAGLLVRSFAELQKIDRGFESRNVATMEIHLPRSRYPDAAARRTFFKSLLQKVSAVPGVVAATGVTVGPGTGNVGLSAQMIFEGQTAEDARQNQWATWEPALPGYFEAVGIPIVHGRPFTAADREGQQPVAIVSESVARQYWPDQNPIGKRLQFVSSFQEAMVVGVAADVRYRELTRNWLTVYFPADQFFFFDPHSMVVRTSGDPDALLPILQQVVRSHEPQVAFESMSTLEALLGRELARPRTALAVTMLFAAIAIFLSGIGVYGVTSYEVRQRVRELAVRSAIGATPTQLFREVARRSLMMAGVGIVAGAGLAIVATRAIRSMLYGVRPTDPVSYAIGIFVLLAIVLSAATVPARRAAGTDPLRTLRVD